MSGWSRRYRNNGRVNAAGDYNPLAVFVDSLPSLGPVVHYPSPVVPLSFERKPPQPHLDSLTAIYGERHMLGMRELEWSSPDVQKACFMALGGYGSPSNTEAMLAAHMALEASPICPEAYNILAYYQATSYDEALSLYMKGEAVGLDVVKEQTRKEVLKEKRCFDYHPLRGHFRSVYGVANTLRKMRRYQESYEKWQFLLKLDPHWYAYSPYVNVYALYPPVLYKAKGAKACLDWMDKFKNTTDQMAYQSSGVFWIMTYALAWYELHPNKGYIHPGCPDPEDILLQCKRGGAMVACCQLFPLVVDMLLGDSPVPDEGKVDGNGSAHNSVSNAVAYWVSCRHFWEEVPGSLEWLRKTRNTFELLCLTHDVRTGLLSDLAEVDQYLQGPFYPDAYCQDVRGLNSSLLDILFLPQHSHKQEFSEVEVELLTKLLAAGCVVQNTCKKRPPCGPLHFTCYQGYGPQVATLLMQHGANPVERDEFGQSALGMTSNQGNWREMKAVLEHSPDLMTKTAKDIGLQYGRYSCLEGLVLDVFRSSCPGCLAGGPRCHRCDPHQANLPHSPHADFFKYIETLVNVGLRCGVEFMQVVLAECQGMHPVYVQLMDHLANCQVKAGGPQILPASLAKLYLGEGGKGRRKGKGRNDKAHPVEEACGLGCSHPHHHHHHHHHNHHHDGDHSCCGHHPAPHHHTHPHVTVSGAGHGSAADQDKKCARCGVRDVKLLKCSRCFSARYCSKDCQVAHWPEHKAVCKKMAKQPQPQQG